MTKREFLLKTSNEHNIKQSNNKNREKYKVGDDYLIWYQIIKTNIIRIVWQTVRRITTEIMGVKGLMSDCLTILKYFSCIWCRTRMPFTLRILEHKVVPHCFFVIPGTLSFPLMSVFKIKWNKIFNKHENMYFYVINRTSTKEPLRKEEGNVTAN